MEKALLHTSQANPDILDLDSMKMVSLVMNLGVHVGG